MDTAGICLYLIVPAEFDVFNLAGLPACDTTHFTLLQQHVNQILRRMVAKQLPFVLLVVSNVVLVHQSNEITRCVTA